MLPATYNTNSFREQQTVDQNTKQIHKGGPDLNMWSAQCQATAKDNTKQNTDKGQTHSQRIEMKISDPAGNETRVDGMKGRYSIDRAMATS